MSFHRLTTEKVSSIDSEVASFQNEGEGLMKQKPSRDRPVRDGVARVNSALERICIVQVHLCMIYLTKTAQKLHMGLSMARLHQFAWSRSLEGNESLVLARNKHQRRLIE